MAKPRIFVSSTFYDLRHIRGSLEGFIEGMGYEPVLFESGNIPFHHELALSDSCYAEVENCHMLVLIIGGRYGAADDVRKFDDTEGREKLFEYFSSVTKREYEAARKRDIPIFIFVDKNVKAEHRTYEANRNNKGINYAHVDNVNIFRLLDEIFSQKNNNFVKEFEKFEDISSWLRDQWAGIFADLISRKREQREISGMAERIAELGELTASLKSYTETIMEKVVPEKASEKIKIADLRAVQSKLDRFGQEIFVRYIIDSHEMLSETPSPSVSEIYSALQKSMSIEDFYELLPGDKTLYKSMLDNTDRNFFRELKRKYFSIAVRRVPPPPDRPLGS